MSIGEEQDLRFANSINNLWEKNSGQVGYGTLATRHLDITNCHRYMVNRMGKGKGGRGWGREGGS